MTNEIQTPPILIPPLVLQNIKEMQGQLLKYIQGVYDAMGVDRNWPLNMDTGEIKPIVSPPQPGPAEGG